jgi:hypothetical protein
MRLSHKPIQILIHGSEKKGIANFPNVNGQRWEWEGTGRRCCSRRQVQFDGCAEESVSVNSAATTRSSATSEPPSLLTTGRAAAPPPAEARKTSTRTTAATNAGDLMAEDAAADRCSEFVGCIAAPYVCVHERMKSSCIVAGCAPCARV